MRHIQESDHGFLYAFGIAIAVGFGFVYSAHAIDKHFTIQDCTVSAIERGENARAAFNNCNAQYDEAN